MNTTIFLRQACKNGIIKNSVQNCRGLSNVPSERKADFIPRVVTKEVFPDIDVLKLRRGTGGRSSYNGLTVTVFGSTGLLARSLVNNLGQIGTQVICPYRGDSYFVKDLKLLGDLGQILFVPFHLRDTDTVHRALKYSNVVVNLIGRDNSTPNFDFESVHVEGARTIARIAKEAGVKRFIHVSALNSSPNPESHWIKGGSNFLKSKYYGELAVREEFPEATIFRPADIYGEMDSFLAYYCRYHRRSYRALALPYGGYGITKTPVYVGDVAQGILNSITDEDAIGQTFDAVGPRRYELRVLMEYLQDVIMKDRFDGFRITNLQWSPLMRTRITVTSWAGNVALKSPKVSWEKIERECITDEKPQNLTLVDLGVRLSFIEDNWPHLLKVWRYGWNYSGDLGEKKLYGDPQYIVE